MEMKLFKMTYKTRENDNYLKILGEDFVKNNKNKGKLAINNKKLNLKDTIFFGNDVLNKINKLKMLLCKNIYNKSFMFKNCELLESFSGILIENDKEKYENNESYEKIEYKEEIIEYDEQNIFDSFNSNIRDYPIYNYMSNTFSQISDIIYKKSYDNYDNSIILYMNNEMKYLNNNYTILREIFYKCESLISLPDITKWDTFNICDMSGMFSHCKSLLSLSDISNWETENVYDMSNLFYNCSSIKSLPDISGWKTFNVYNMSNIFTNCKHRFWPCMDCYVCSLEHQLFFLNFINIHILYYITQFVKKVLVNL